jgi:hypothetical protein
MCSARSAGRAVLKGVRGVRASCLRRGAVTFFARRAVGYGLTITVPVKPGYTEGGWFVQW